MSKFLFLLLFSIIIHHPTYSIENDSLSFGPFGKVFLYKSVPAPSTLVLFVSGDGGWNLGVVEMAKIFAEMNAWVVGIDIVNYYKNLRKSNVKCYYSASDFENLSIYIQKKLAVHQYLKPILVGYSSGATLVYGLLVQAPANTFKGAISLGFCPDIEIDKPLCDGSGLKSKVIKPGKSFYLEPSENLSAPFIILQGMNDIVCDHQSTSDFITGMKNAEIISLPKVGHGFSVQKNWVPQLKKAFQKIIDTPVFYEKNKQSIIETPQGNTEFANIQNLPVVTFPSEKTDSGPMIILISGDGGWTSWDHSLALEFARYGIPVAGLDAQKYFWEEKTPTSVTSDVINLLKYYTIRWNKHSFLLIGYSFGADVVPFIASKLLSPIREQLLQLVMLSPDPRADFEIHITDMLNLGSGQGKYDVVREVRSLNKISVVCLFGDEEDESDKNAFRLPLVRIMTLPGSHHYKNDFPLIVGTILRSKD